MAQGWVSGPTYRSALLTTAGVSLRTVVPPYRPTAFRCTALPPYRLS